MLHELMTARPFAEFDPSHEDSEIARSIYRRGVAAVARYLDQDGSTASARDAVVVVSTHGGLVDAELSGRLGNSPAPRKRKYRLGVGMILAGLASAPEAH